MNFPNYESPSSNLVKMYLSGEFCTQTNKISPYIASTFYAIDRIEKIHDEIYENIKSFFII